MSYTISTCNTSHCSFHHHIHNKKLVINCAICRYKSYNRIHNTNRITPPGLVQYSNIINNMDDGNDNVIISCVNVYNISSEDRLNNSIHSDKDMDISENTTNINEYDKPENTTNTNTNDYDVFFLKKKC